MNIYGLIGRDIDYSFSRTYFAEKFKNEDISAEYRNFDLPAIEDIEEVFVQTSGLSGLNVTIPYKQAVIPFLDGLDENAKQIAAVNTIKIDGNKRIGYNTDYFGFSESLKPFLQPHHKKALILGTGGASKAVAFALDRLGISFHYVSRTEGAEKISYSQLNEDIILEHTLIINCTPLGTFPNIKLHPDIPFQHLNSSHLIYDLIYNPASTQLMKLAENQGAVTTNGLRMLELQAEKAWEIWNS